ncbi:hypothetical protein [Paenarthrobacter sp. PH39-S1]|uniref:hypothetical protein n=1 Tax=Paenarthrobacter sp. PH39-S1 TaxID=3046204 RepID=UPI0024B9B738|nr:hypothetical protein [Paenarthrobacter sp. PH39-S1]MDJ0357018.1 hypothetical protein [Paenarthrobacter sp. PH39-S1]
MRITDELHRLILGLDGVSTVYPADPSRRTADGRLAATLTPGASAPEPAIVDLRIADSLATVRIQAGPMGAPAGSCGNHRFAASR